MLRFALLLTPASQVLFAAGSCITFDTSIDSPRYVLAVEPFYILYFIINAFKQDTSIYIIQHTQLAPLAS